MMIRKLALIPAAGALALLALTGCQAPTSGTGTVSPVPAAPAVSSPAAVAPVPAPAPAPAPAPVGTVSQRNAVKKAEDYLGYSAFSKPGLVKQLTFEGFSAADAAYAVEHITVDWTVQADKKAKAYMGYSSFSRASLIKQLTFEGFTQEEATHGATSVGL